MNNPLLRQTAGPAVPPPGETPAQNRIRNLNEVAEVIEYCSDAADLKLMNPELLAAWADRRTPVLARIIGELRAQEASSGDVATMDRKAHALAAWGILTSQLRMLEWLIDAHLKPLSLDPPAKNPDLVPKLIVGIGALFSIYNEGIEIADVVRNALEAEGGAR